MDAIEITLVVNGQERTTTVDPRMTLADFIREEMSLTGTHLGCEQGVCGACTILFDGESARSCLMLAAQAHGHEIVTIEDLAAPDGTLHPIQAAFSAKHGLQCGFCTPGMVLSTYELLNENDNPSLTEVKERLSGNVCRCTGYTKIFESVSAAAEEMRAAPPVQHSGHRNGEV